jgi:hypothetical protein
MMLLSRPQGISSHISYRVIIKAGSGMQGKIAISVHLDLTAKPSRAAESI